jgi:tape measure domain-containing protein
MTTVDNRVVGLDFDNKGFETGVKQSSKSIENLKKSLNFEESAKNIGRLSRAGKSFSLATMGEGVQNISSKFSALGVVGFTVIQNLTNAAINYGKKLVRSLTDPLKMGFAEYETQMNAIQTVLANTASKGTTLKDVSAALDELNTYADKTIYNFTEMTRNIGTFTAAGVDLETSTAAIKGIANLAAVSGSNSQQASTAMYQLSQALSSGTVKLMDWNSVVNAGMGGQVFQDALKETARVSGIAIDDLIDKHGSFRETLSTGWLSSEVLLNTLQKFTGDLNKEQLLTMGYTEEQIEGILKLGQTANDAATKVKTFTQLKDTLQEAIQSGWTKSWELIIGDFEEAKAFFTEVSDTLGALISASADARNKILRDWKKFGGRTIAIEAIRNVFDGLLRIMAPIKEAFREIFPPMTGHKLRILTGIIRDLTERLLISGETADKIKRIFKGVFSVFAIAIDVVKGLVGVFFDLAGAIPISGDGILDFLANIGDFLVALREGTDVAGGFEQGLSKIRGVLDIFSNGIVTAKRYLKEWGTSIRDTFGNIADNIDSEGLREFFDKFTVRLKPFEALLKAVGFVINALLKGAQKLIPALFKVGEVIAKFVMNIGQQIGESLGNVDFIAVFDAINAGLIAAILLAIRNFISKGSGFIDEATDIFGNVAEILDGVRGSLEAWQQNLKSKTLLNLAIAIGIIAASLVVLSAIDSKKLTIALGILTGVFAQLVISMGVYSKIGGGSAIASVGLLAMSTSILIMAGAVSKLAKLNVGDMQNAIGIIYALMAGMLIFSRLMTGNMAGMLKGSIGLIALSISLRLFVGVIEKLGVMDPAVIIQGLIAIGAILAELSIFTRATGSDKGMIATAIGLTVLGLAMEIFVDVIRKLGGMSIKELATGLGGMAVALLIISAAMRALPKSMILQATGLLVVAAALLIMSKALENMGGMTWEQIAKGLATLAGALLILTVGLYAMSGTLAGSFALLVAAGALAVLAPVLALLGGMPLSEIGIALLALAGVFTVLGIAGVVLTPVVPVLLGLGAAMLLIGVGAALVGAGLLAFSTGLLAIAAGGTAAAIGIVAFITTLLGLLPVIAKTLIDTLIVFAKGIKRAAPEVAAAITALMLGFLQVIIDTAPKIFETLDLLLKGLIQLIVDNIPEFISAVVLLLVTLLQEIAAKMPDFIQAGFDILIGFLTGIRDNIGEVVTVVVEIVTEFIGAVAENLPDIVQSGWDLMIAFIDSMADSIDNNMQPALDAIGRLATSIIDGLVKGITTGGSRFIATLKQLARDAIAAAFKVFESESPSKVFTRLGNSLPEGLVIGVKSLARNVINTVKDLGNKTIDTMSNSLTGVNDLLLTDIDMDPTIRPVLDMSDVVEGSSLLNELFGDKSLNLVPVVATTSRVASNMGRQYDQQGNVINEGTNISFVQNNMSPKALSRLEIYRQTRNQLKTLKGVIKE